MNLRNGNITIKEILDYKPANDFLTAQYPFIKNHPMLHRANKITVNMALMFAGDAITKQQKDQIIDKLKSL